jgi:hypothetical protein
VIRCSHRCVRSRSVGAAQVVVWGDASQRGARSPARCAALNDTRIEEEGLKSALPSRLPRRFNFVCTCPRHRITDTSSQKRIGKSQSIHDFGSHAYVPEMVLSEPSARCRRIGSFRHRYRSPARSPPNSREPTSTLCVMTPVVGAPQLPLPPRSAVVNSAAPLTLACRADDTTTRQKLRGRLPSERQPMRSAAGEAAVFALAPPADSQTDRVQSHPYRCVETVALAQMRFAS